MQIIPRGNDSGFDIQKLLESDPRLVSFHTRRQYKSDLLDFEAYRNGAPLTKSLVEAYAAHLQGGDYAPATINQRLAAIRWYARKIADLALDYDPKNGREIAERAARVITVRDVKGERPERGRHIEPGELSALINACLEDKNRAAGIRDAAMLAIAWSTGLRREEIAGIELADLTPRNDEEMDLSVKGKGGKARAAYINDGALYALRDWISLRGNDPGRLFTPVTRTGKILSPCGIQPGKLSGEAMRKMLRKRSIQAGLSQEITWHDFRRTFAGNLWDAKIDGVTIQKLMGHATQNQTAKYDRRPEALRRRAVRVLHVPYRPK